MKKGVTVDYVILEDTLCIMSLLVEPRKRRKGLGTNVLHDIIQVARQNNCTEIVVPSDLSKIALAFWLKNGFYTQEDDDKEKINIVLNSDKRDEHIFDVEDNSVVELHKKI